MNVIDYLKTLNPFGSAPVTNSTPVVTAQKTEFVYKPSLWDRFFTSGPAVALEQALTPANDTITALGGTTGIITDLRDGVKWGLILGGVILALYVIVEFRLLKGK